MAFDVNESSLEEAPAEGLKSRKKRFKATCSFSSSTGLKFSKKALGSLGSLIILGPWFLTQQIDTRHRNEVTMLIRALGPAFNLSLQALVVSRFIGHLTLG